MKLYKLNARAVIGLKWIISPHSVKYFFNSAKSCIIFHKIHPLLSKGGFSNLTNVQHGEDENVFIDQQLAFFLEMVPFRCFDWALTFRAKMIHTDKKMRYVCVVDLSINSPK